MTGLKRLVILVVLPPSVIFVWIQAAGLFLSQALQLRSPKLHDWAFALLASAIGVVVVSALLVCVFGVAVDAWAWVQDGFAADATAASKTAEAERIGGTLSMAEKSGGELSRTEADR